MASWMRPSRRSSISNRVVDRGFHDFARGRDPVWIGLLAVAIAVGFIHGSVTGARGDDFPALLQFAPTSLRIPRTLQRVTTMTFSPDGNYLASGSGWYDREGSIQVWEVKTGTRVGLELLPIGASSIAWTPDGKHIAASTWDSSVRVYAFPGLQQTTRFAVDRSVSRFGVSPDSKQIVTATEGYRPTDDSLGRTVQIWDADAGTLVRTCESQENLFRLVCAAWSPKGKYVAAAGGNFTRNPQGLGRLWFAETGQEAARLEGHTGYIRGLRFFPDDGNVATTGIDGTIRIWESATGKEVLKINVGSPVESLDIARDGTLIACGTSSGEVTLWDPEAGRKIGDLTAEGAAAISVAFSPDGTTLASGGADAVIRLWNVADRKLIRELPPLGSPYRPHRALALAPASDGELVIIAGDDGSLRAVNVVLEQELWIRHAPVGEFPTAIAVAADKKRILVGYEDGAVRFHAAGDGKALLDLKRMPARISAVAWAGTEPLLAAGDAQGRVWLWTQNGHALLTERQDHRGAVLAIGFADKGTLVSSIGADGSAVCRQTAGDEKAAEARVGGAPISSATISLDGSTALVLGPRLATWDAVQLKLRRRVNLPLNPPLALALSADGSNVLVSNAFGTFVDGPQAGTTASARVTDSREAGVIALSADNRVLFQGTEQGALRVSQAIPPRQSPLARIRRVGNVAAVATSPDGKWLAAGGDDSQVSVWSLESGEQVESLPGGGGTIYACQFSPDSRLLASSTLAGTVKVWGVEGWTLEGSLLNPKRSVRCVAFSPDGRWLATGGSDCTLLVTDTKT